MKTLNSKFIERGSTLFLKIILLFLVLGTLSIGGWFVYLVATSSFLGDYKFILMGVSISLIPFLYIFYQSYRLLIFIDKNLSLTNSSVNALKIIMNCAFIISALYLIGSPFVFKVADKDDAPGVVLINLIMIVIPFAVGVFSAILQKLLINAISYKSENELTI